MDNPEENPGYRTTDTNISFEKTQKEQRWKQVATEFNKITDKLGLPIDAGILDTVIALNLFNVNTTQSCEGHIDRAIAAPWVDIQAPETDELKQLRVRAKQTWTTIDAAQKAGKPDEDLAPLYQNLHRLNAEVKRPQLKEIQKVTRLLAEFYQNRQVPYERILTIHGYRLESQGVPFQEIISPEERRKKLLEYQEEMKAFTAFLKNKYTFTQ